MRNMILGWPYALLTLHSLKIFYFFLLEAKIWFKAKLNPSAHYILDLKFCWQYSRVWSRSWLSTSVNFSSLPIANTTGFTTVLQVLSSWLVQRGDGLFLFRYSLSVFLSSCRYIESMVHFASIRHPAAILDDLHGKVLNEAYQISKSTVTESVSSTEQSTKAWYLLFSTVFLSWPAVERV